MQHRPTLEDVARHAGVSRALVSIVMRDVPGASDETRARVRLAADEIGYRPDPRARRLRQLRTKLLGVAFATGQEFHAELVDGVYAAADEFGYDVVLSGVTRHHDESRAVRTLLDDRCEALLLLGPQLSAAELIRLATTIPVVVVARRLRGVDAVRSDDTAGAAMAVEYLHALGHRDIVHLDGGRAPGAAERRRGYTQAMRAAGLTAATVPGGLTEREGAAATTALLGSGAALPSAIFAFNDRCALGVLDVLVRARVAVPQRVSVLGFDDSPAARLAHIDLSTIRQETRQLARAAVARLVSRLDETDDSTGPVDIVVPPTLVVRGTTSAPTATG
ncbi:MULTISPECIES: LacI family DNA-binding transcriptional regulator [unclassified Mycolicibacterium]|jgi:DNA-binding LacI/PurR family transcriptional regulator|uniref:LacI family DNA-binding transcriptional regulator n=1 Tax=unclassified Mycolicibacterium TaxID=2636767 RepID=UPI00224AE435|nr:MULTISPECIES: LacI family DNA-binding transcriptional regulator [unclassified Mycolicibacterium]MCX2710890.1 LacI family DNA-binding transcriptional regulator [Mycolicibacterium sp. J2]MDX1871965.1 LacI family DNA-binding transcriptional regulator [Mycolicibacterium sp. 120266]